MDQKQRVFLYVLSTALTNYGVLVYILLRLSEIVFRFVVTDEIDVVTTQILVML